jgi:hypothetical protein
VNTKIKRLKAQAEELTAKRDAILDRLQVEYNKAMCSDARISKAIADVENSDKLAFESGELYTWIAVDWLGEFAPIRGFLDGHLADFGITVDWGNHNLMCSIGGYLQVNDDGVYDTDLGRFVIRSEEYGDDETKRNSLIEAHMEKTGYFPSVVSVDRHGNAFFISTQELQNKVVSK